MLKQYGILLTFLFGAAGLQAVGASRSVPKPPTMEEQMLGHVEKVLVLDSIAVDRYEFFRRYNIRPSAGRILSGEEVGAALSGVQVPVEFQGSPFTGFTNEFEDYLVWAQQDTTGYLRLAESVRLGDGSWSSPRFTPAVLNTGDEDDEAPIEANAAFPFMSDDGQTLYFASDNEMSLGGYDIFIATKDPSDGEFLIPGNVGMPFNSPYDDYLMVLDNQTGVGWWATDRNQLEDKVTIYVYALSDERVNVDPDDEDLLSYATLSGWENLLDEEQQAVRRRLLAELPTGKATAAMAAPDFSLPMPGGQTYHYFTEFNNKKAASQMQLYLSSAKALDSKRADLASLRKQFASGDKKTASKIQALEEEVRRDESSLRKILSDIYKLESQQ